jgi:hypothetical protein
MRSSVTTLVFLGLLSSGCQTDNVVVESGDGQVASYPVTAGTSWTYERIATAYDVRIEDSSATVLLDTINATILVSVLKDTVLRPGQFPGTDSVKVTSFQEIYAQRFPVPTPPGIIEGVQYFSLDQNALWIHGYKGAGDLALPKRAHRPPAISLNGRSFASLRQLVNALLGINPSVGTDSLVREIPPLLSLRFPLTIGAEWTFRERGHPFRIDKKVVGDSGVTVAGIRYECAKVQWLYDLDGNGLWDTTTSIIDFVSPQGLLNRTIDITDAILTGSGSPDMIGTFNWKDEYTATTVDLK